MAVDLLLPCRSGINIPIVPICDQAGASKDGEVLTELIPILLVPMRVRIEYFDWPVVRARHIRRFPERSAGPAGVSFSWREREVPG